MVNMIMFFLSNVIVYYHYEKVAEVKRSVTFYFARMEVVL